MIMDFLLNIRTLRNYRMKKRKLRKTLLFHYLTRSKHKICEKEGKPNWSLKCPGSKESRPIFKLENRGYSVSNGYLTVEEPCRLHVYGSLYRIEYFYSNLESGSAKFKGIAVRGG